MSLLRCNVCGHERSRTDCVVVTPTEAEKVEIQKLGHAPKDEYVYCNPCWRLIGNREAGARLMRGLAVASYKAQGHLDPEAAADRVYAFLVEKSGRRLSS